jgi:hypothetical protein
MDKRPPRITRAENQARVDQIINDTKARGVDKIVGDALVLAFLAGRINHIPGTAFHRSFGECFGEDQDLC